MILTLALTGVALILSLVAYTEYAIRREKRAVIETLRLYFEAPDEQTPSEFARLIDTTADIYSKHMLDRFKTSFMGMQSVESRNEKALKGEIAQAVIAQENPLLSSLIASFPALRKRLAKSPELLPLAQSLLGKVKGNPDGSRDIEYTGEIKV